MYILLVESHFKLFILSYSTLTLNLCTRVANVPRRRNEQDVVPANAMWDYTQSILAMCHPLTHPHLCLLLCLSQTSVPGAPTSAPTYQ